MFDQGKFDQCFFIVSDCLCAKLYDITFFAGAKWWYLLLKRSGSTYEGLLALWHGRGQSKIPTWLLALRHGKGLWYLGTPTQCFTPCPGAMYHLSLVLPGQQGNLFQELRGNQATFLAILFFLQKGVNHLRTLADWETAPTLWRP